MDNVMENVDVVNSIVNGSWFQDLADDKIQQLIELSTIKEYKTGDFVYMVGQQQEHVYCIVDGKLSISIIDPAGEEFWLTIWEAGRWFGEAAFHEDGVMPLQARTMTPATIVAMPISAIDQVLENGTVFYRNLMLDMVGRAKLLYKLIEILLFRPLRSRVAMRVLHLAETFGEPDGSSIILPIKFSQSDFAQMSGGSRQRVNQIFRDWSDKGVVNKKDKRYVVQDIAALKAELEATEDYP